LEVAPASLTNLNASELTTGEIPEPRVPAVIARVSNIMPEVLSHDGSGSNLNADLLDGKHAADFAASSHTHAGMVTNTKASWVFIPGTQFNLAFNGAGVNMTFLNTGSSRHHGSTDKPSGSADPAWAQAVLLPAR
jgi:hypothetical protein